MASSIVSLASHFNSFFAREGSAQYSGKSPVRREENLHGSGFWEIFSNILIISRTEVGCPVAKL